MGLCAAGGTSVAASLAQAVAAASTAVAKSTSGTFLAIIPLGVGDGLC